MQERLASWKLCAFATITVSCLLALRVFLLERRIALLAAEWNVAEQYLRKNCESAERESNSDEAKSANSLTLTNYYLRRVFNGIDNRNQ
jgi:hypothetical protein